MTWSSYRATSPPPEGALFGRAQDAAEGEVAGCVSPATVGGGSAELRPYFPSTPAASILADLGVDEGRSGWVDGSPIDTPFVSLPGLVRAGCVTRDGFSYLEVDVQGDPGDPRADDISGDLTPEWGLHLVDFNLVMGDVVDLVGRQVDAYLSD